MKRSLLFAAVLLAASPVFAAQDLCKINLEKLHNYKASSGVIGQPQLDQIHDARVQAEAAQKAGDNEKCISLTNQALDQVVKAQKGK